MEISIANLVIGVKRKENSRTAGLSSEQISEESDLIRRQLDYLPSGNRSRLLATVSVGEGDSYGGFRAARALLDDRGLAVVPGFVSAQRAREVGTRVLSEVDSFNSSASLASDTTGLRIEHGGSSNYEQLTDANHATAVFRSGVDDGMIDIFNFDLWNKEHGAWLRQCLSSPGVMDLMRERSGGVSLVPANLNVYVNVGVSQTRGFHVDSYGGRQVKAFLYLTDVCDYQDGPYTYVLDSHKPSVFRTVNQALSQGSTIFRSTDTPLVDRDKAVAVLASAGSLVVSDQSGSHRGYPQASGHSRVLAVLNFK